LEAASAGIESPTVLSETEDVLAERRTGLCPIHGSAGYGMPLMPLPLGI